MRLLVHTIIIFLPRSFWLNYSVNPTTVNSGTVDNTIGPLTQKSRHPGTTSSLPLLDNSASQLLSVLWNWPFPAWIATMPFNCDPWFQSCPLLQLVPICLRRCCSELHSKAGHIFCCCRLFTDSPDRSKLQILTPLCGGLASVFIAGFPPFRCCSLLMLGNGDSRRRSNEGTWFCTQSYYWRYYWPERIWVFCTQFSYRLIMGLSSSLGWGGGNRFGSVMASDYVPLNIL